MINGVEKVLMLLFYHVWVRVLVLKYRRTRLNSEVSYYGKDFICRKTHDKKKEKVKPKLSGEKNVSTKVFRVCIV